MLKVQRNNNYYMNKMTSVPALLYDTFWPAGARGLTPRSL